MCCCICPTCVFVYLQCVVVCCSVLQCAVASTLLHFGLFLLCCSVLQCVAVCCSSCYFVTVCVIVFASAYQIPYRTSWYVIPYQGFLKLKCPLWVPVRAQQNGHGIVWAAAATQHSLSAGICTCTLVLYAPVVARSLNPPFRHSRRGVLQPPPRRSHAYFAELSLILSACLFVCPSHCVFVGLCLCVCVSVCPSECVFVCFMYVCMCICLKKGSVNIHPRTN